MTKLIFMGTPDFSVPILEGLIKNDQYEIVGVVTQPDRPVGRKKMLTSTPVKEVALRYNLPIFQPETMKDESFLADLAMLKPDIIITAAFGQFLPQKVLEMAPFGVINVHASLLPKYRGGAPIHEAIIRGEKETGVTIMKTVLKMDAGDILSKEVVPITKEDNVGTMFDKLSLVGRDLLLKTLPRYLNDEITLIPQDESKATIAPNISREAEILDFSKTAEELDCKVRGMNPWPVAHTMWEGKRLKIFAVKVLDLITKQEPGTVIKKDKNELYVACGRGTVLSLCEVQLAGKSKMTIKQFLNGSGQKLQVGAKLG